MRRTETRVVHVDPTHPDAAALSGAASIIRAGGTVAFPTETVYGLGANGLDDAAVRRIFAAKERPADNPLILHIAALSELDSLVTAVPATVRALAERFWPGPLTLVLPRSPRVPAVVSAGLPTVAIRWPAHPVAQALVRAAGVPIAAPSANLSGRPSPTTADHVLADLGGRIDLIIDGGPAAVGLESTVLDLVGPTPTLLRPGGVTLEMLQSVLGEVAVAPGVSADPREAPVARPRSPGMKYRHYAPKAPLTLVEGAPEAVLGEIRRLVAAHPRDGGRLALLVSAEAADGLRDLVAVGQDEPSLVILGRRDDPEGMAAALFARLRELDEAGAALIIAEGYADTGVGLALMNRLRRAAGGRVVRVGSQSEVSAASAAAGYDIRPAVPADLPGIARVHVDSWRTTYQGIVSDAFLEGLSYERSEARNRSLMERPDAPPHVFVATAPDGAVVGFAMGGPTRSDDTQFTGELYGIYLLKEQQGHGLGRGLVHAMAKALAADGHRSLIVWVLAANPSRSFYEALGAEYHRTQSITIGGQELTEVAYGWPDITVLLKS